MMTRLLAGLIVAPVAAISALYGTALLVGAPGNDAEAYSEPPGEPRLDLPYQSGEAADWLASVLAGTGPYPVQNGSEVDLASMARAARQTPETVTAQCASSHVALSCSLTEIGVARYGFSLQNMNGRWDVLEESVHRYDAP